MLLLVKNIPRYASYRLLFDSITNDLGIGRKYLKLAFKPGKAVGYLRIRNKEELSEEIRGKDGQAYDAGNEHDHLLAEGVQDVCKVGDESESREDWAHKDANNALEDDNSNGVILTNKDNIQDMERSSVLVGNTENDSSNNKQINDVQSVVVERIGGCGNGQNDELDVKIFAFLCKKEIKIGKNVITLKQIEERQRKTRPSIIIEDIRDIVTPLWRHTKEIQRSMKLSNLNSFLEKNALPPAKELVSPVNTQRNNFEFVFGFNAEGRPRVGFRGQSFRDNKNLCYECTNVEFIGELRQQIDLVNEMVDKHGWMVYDREKGTGYLRMMKVRVVNGNEHLVLVDIDGSNERREEQVCSERRENAESSANQLDVSTERFFTLFKPCPDEHVLKLYEFLTGLPFANVSFAFNRTKFEGISPGPSFLVKGASHLFQHIHNLKFKISFFSFFQTNIEMLQAMIKRIKMEKKNNPYLIDLCCGSLVLGMMLCSDFEEVIGIENNPECVKDFGVNRNFNGVENCRIMGVDVNTVSISEIARRILEGKDENEVGGACDTGVNGKEVEKSNGKDENEMGGAVNGQDLADAIDIPSNGKKIANKSAVRMIDGSAGTTNSVAVHTTSIDETVSTEKNITVVLDPPRAGVNKRLIKKLRECTAVDELFYISCDYNQSIGNIKDLTRKESKAYKSGFTVVGTYAFDMFPGNNKVEVLYHLVRLE
ncbi:hypothetical protein VCUG_00185 [Vavraia culicis subsp. floridensis]|uniref:tRNA (Uracil-5-)-methyltransferase n=1 Tax=Vavraia culicis (isolate floridensis) TaxID=948595 RepID=L2GXJ0_VAVCU|nr:uncharacterized protein VCUG_00185 [Vavraia culicis subsp. floridensis]ELA48349.1 hypothetical protein VCUG_00185 [Vavraia culicis subsp. floridensis]